MLGEESTHMIHSCRKIKNLENPGVTLRKPWCDTHETLLGEYWILYPCRTTPAPQLLENGELEPATSRN
jgi:hypothetical protein